MGSRTSAGLSGTGAAPGLPSGEHENRLVAVDDDEACEDRAVGAVQLDPLGRRRHLPEPFSELPVARPAPGEAPPDMLQQRLAQQLDYREGQIASVMAATSTPASAAAAPFLVASLCSTRMT